MKIYLDTNIYLDYLENREDRLRPLGEFAFQLIRRALKCEFVIVLSTLVLSELEGLGHKENAESILNSLRKARKLYYIETTPEHRKIAGEMSRKRKTPYGDTLHSILAKESGAEILITRNLKDFGELRDIIPLSAPESL